MPIYRAIYSGPPRSYGGETVKKYITIHNTSNARDASAEDEASYAKNRTDGTSSHYYVDRDSIVQSLNTDLRANHVGSRTGNNTGIAYEITGTNSKTRDWWLNNVAWGLLVKQIRLDCEAHGITPRLLTVDQIKAGSLTGIITHNQARLVWGGTDHTDPGANFPMDHLLALLAGNAEEDDMPTVEEFWNTDGAVPAPPYALKDDPKNTHWTAGNYLRSSRERIETLVAETRAVRAGQAAILAAVQGLDTDEVLAAVNSRAAEDVARDTALLSELRELASGGATATEIVDQLAARLSGQ